MISTDRPARELQVVRDRILETGEWPGDVGLRPSIANSWQRCMLSGVSPEVLAPRHEPAPNLDSQFLRAAKPVVEKCGEQLSGTSTSLIMGDRNGLVLHMWSDDNRLGRLLDNAHSSPGFFLDESVAGTNGLGTVLEEQQPIQIAGGEHFVNAFQQFTCVGVPIRHPITRQLRGVLNLSCRSEEANNLLLPFALQVAHDIEGSLYLESSRRERLLLEQFLALHRRSARPVVVLNEDVIIASPAAARSLDGVDQAHLWEYAAQAVGSCEPQVTDLLLHSGEVLAAQCRPVTDGRAVIGAVIEFDSSAGAAPSRRIGVRRAAEPALAGLTGTSAAWREACKRALTYRDSDLPMLVTGEPGAGKRALVNALFELAVQAGEVRTLDAAMHRVDPAHWMTTLAEGMRGDARSVVIRHLHALDPSVAQAVCALVDGAAGNVRVVATSDSGADVYQPLVDRLSVIAIEVPPLRERLEDLPALLTELTRKHAGNVAPPRWLPAAVQVLGRLDWPANVRQLENLVRLVLATRQTGDIRVDDLPEDVRGQAPRRPLSHLEGVELKAIMGAMQRTRGNKTAAADLLGISRATLYRKIRSFGIDLGRTAF